jgi:hypothetical protein
MIALSYSIIILIGFICLIAARSTVEGKLGSPEAKHKGLQLLLENLSPEQFGRGRLYARSEDNAREL